MTKDEDDWLSDFLEAAQSSARQSQVAAEKDYATKIKLLAPRFERARAGDAGEQLAQRLAASEALAGLKKFDAASDALDEAAALAGSLLRASAVAASPAVVDPVEEPAEPVPAESAPVDGPSIPSEEFAVEAESAAADANFDDLLTGETPEEASPEVLDQATATDASAEPTAVDAADAAIPPPAEAAPDDAFDDLAGLLETGDAPLAGEASPEVEAEESQTKSDP